MYFDAHTDILSDVTVRRLRGERDVLQNHHLRRLRQGGVEGCILAIWVDPPYTADPAARTRQIMACAQAEMDGCEEIQVVHTVAELQRARARGKLYVFLGVEGLAAIGTDLRKLDTYYEFGVRHAMLTWNEENALGAGAATGKDTGLTDLGKQAVRCLQDRGMLVDVSHLNQTGFWDVARLARRPIVATHSNARALCDVPRNLTDAQLRAIRDLGGVVGLNAYRGFIDSDPAKQTVEGLARHAAHLIDVMGIEHVGCGFDFCDFIGMEPTPGLEDCTKIDALFALLEGMGLTREERERIAFRNFWDVIGEAVG